MYKPSLYMLTAFLDVYPIKLRSICYCPILNIYINKVRAYTRTLLSILPFLLSVFCKVKKLSIKSCEITIFR